MSTTLIQSTRSNSRAGDAIVGLLFILASSLIALKSLYYFDHNDFLYASAAARTGTLYKDIHLVQAPLAYWVWHWIYLLAPTGYAYAAMRIVSALLTVAAIVPILIFVLRTNFQRAAFLLLLASSYYVIRSGFEIASYSLALALLSAAISAFMSNSTRAIVLSGVLFGLAASAKINHVLFVFPAVLFILLDRGPLKPRLDTAIRFLMLVGVGLLPLIYYFATNFHGTYFHNIIFHSELTYKTRDLSLMSSLRDIAGDLAFFCRHYLVEIGLLGTVLAVVALRYRHEGGFSLRSGFDALLHDERYRSLTIVSGFLLTSMIVAVSPLILFVQYLIPAAFLMLIALVLSFELLSPDQERFALVAVCLICAARLILGLPDVVLPVLERRTVLSEHISVSRGIDKVVANHPAKPPCESSVFSISGSFVIDTSIGLSKYTEGGIFWSHVDGSVDKKYSRDDRFHFDPNLTRPIDYVLGQPVAYVLVGHYFDRAFEQQFAAQSAAHGYTPFQVGEFLGNPMTLFVKAECTS